MENTSVNAEAPTVLVDRKALRSIVSVCIGVIAGGTGGEAETKRQLLEVLESGKPIPDSLVSSLIGYPGHRADRPLANLLSLAFRGRELTVFDKDAVELMQHEAHMRGRTEHRIRNPSI